MGLSQPLYNPLFTGKKGLIVLVIVGSLFIVWAVFLSPYLAAGLAGTLFFGLFLSSRTFRWMIFPTVLILNQYIVVNSGVSFLFGGLFIQPIDWVALLLILAVLLNRVFRGAGLRVRTGLEMPVWTFLAATGFSLINASDLKAGVIFWGHNVLYFIAFYAMVMDWERVPLNRIWRVYFSFGVLAALSALWNFFASGGARSLGLAGIPLNHLIIPVLCFEMARLSLGGNIFGWWVVAFFVVTAVATETRGVWLSGGVLFVVWLFSGFFLRPFKSVAIKRLAPKVIGIVLLLVLLVFVLDPFLGQVERRAEQMGQHSGTVYLRLFLWGLAWQLFLEHPIAGIGMGQFATAVERFPEVKNLAVFEWTRGLSAHNLLLSFLAETGLVGTFAFLLLLVLIIRFAWKGIKGARTLAELNWGWGLFLLFNVFAISFLFAGTWDYHFTFFLALLVLHVRKLETPLERLDAR